MHEFQKRLCNVVAVCKGSKEGARKWRTRLGFDLPTLADERGELVHGFDFPPSAWNAARTAVCREIASKVGSGPADVAETMGAAMMASTANTIYQTGGEIILDSKGKVLLAHKCRTQEDRPRCTDLLALMTKDIEQLTASTPRVDSRSRTGAKVCTIL